MIGSLKKISFYLQSVNELIWMLSSCRINGLKLYVGRHIAQKMMHIRKSPRMRRGSEATNVECNVSLELLQVIFLPLLILLWHFTHTVLCFA
jgi:hypothetical protein